MVSNFVGVLFNKSDRGGRAGRSGSLQLFILLWLTSSDICFAGLRPSCSPTILLFYSSLGSNAHQLNSLILDMLGLGDLLTFGKKEDRKTENHKL